MYRTSTAAADPWIVQHLLERYLAGALLVEGLLTCTTVSPVAADHGRRLIAIDHLKHVAIARVTESAFQLLSLALELHVASYTIVIVLLDYINCTHVFN